MTIFVEVAAFLGLAVQLARGAIEFSRDVYVFAASLPALNAAFAIAFLSGISEMIGQSVVLVVNRVPLYRFIASLLFTGLIYLVAALSWAASVVVVAPLFRAEIVDVIGYAGLFAIISMSFAPRLLGVLTIAPYFGVAFGYLLDAWVLACVIFGLHAASDLPLLAATICGGVGWTTSFAIRALLGRVLREPLLYLRRLVSGSALEMTPQQILHVAHDQTRHRETSR